MTQIDKSRAFPHMHHNINLLWADLLIEELTRHGINDYCIAPGSRSTPLTLAVSKHPKAISHVHFDERGLGFLALGISQATLKPVVVITTSGTAVANLYPAVIEARQSQLPLIILSADRPPELINCAANQAIEQHGIFSNYPVFFCQLPCASESIKSNFLLTTIDQGLFKQQHEPGPIHFNISIREPFYPADESIDFSDYLSSLGNWLTQTTPFTQYHAASVSPHQKIDLNATKVIIVVGRIKDKNSAFAIENFCKKVNAVLFADIQSQLQYSAYNIQGYDLLLENAKFNQLALETDLILQFSDHIISKRLNSLIEKTKAARWLIHKDAHRIDPSHRVEQRFVMEPTHFIDSIEKARTAHIDWGDNMLRYQQKLPAILSHYLVDAPLSEINSCAYMLNKTQHNVVIGNSMPIRLADMFAQTGATIYTNRGASGIDGLIATAAGVACKSDQATCLLIGDTSFLYDLNSLALLSTLSLPFIIVLLNNDGGGIFNLLPVPKAQQKQFYQLPHGLTFEKVCVQFAINYQKPSTLLEFQVQYNQALSHHQQYQTTLIEVCVDNALTAKQLQEIKDEIKNAII